MRARPYGERIQHIAPCDCVDGRPLARLDNWRSVLRERDFRRAGSFWRLSLSCCFDTALQSKCQLCFGGNVQLGVWVAMIFRLKKTDVLLGFFFRANHSNTLSRLCLLFYNKISCQKSQSSYLTGFDRFWRKNLKKRPVLINKFDNWHFHVDGKNLMKSITS